MATVGRNAAARDAVRADSERHADAHSIVDGRGRRIDHLRLSVTSACDLRCCYCRPAAGLRARAEGLSDRQRLDLVTFLWRDRGLRQLRLTGGEPLLHPSSAAFIGDIRTAAPDLSIAMTTNGGRLAGCARELRAAGLDRLNISFDAIDGPRYRAMTGGRVEDVIAGIDVARALGFESVKLNTVVIAGQNDDQVVELAEWSLRRGLEIRFLEAMPIGPAAEFNRAHFVPARRIREILESRFRLSLLPHRFGETAVRYVADGDDARGTIGIIAPISESFCGQCRRMRITADGKLFPCLLDSRCVDLAACWTGGQFDSGRAGALLEQAVDGKRAAGPLRQRVSMVTLGG